MSDRLLDGELHTTLPLAASSGSWPATRDVATSPTRRLAIDSDPTTLAKLRQIIQTQFDYEILMKRHELRNIRAEIRKGENLLLHLHHVIINGISAPETRISSPSHIHPLLRPSGRPTRIASLQTKHNAQSNDVLYSRRDDGIYVRLSCPSCKRWEFANMQGFLNHCRIKHDMEFPSHSEAARACGAPVNESEVPANHLARRMPVKPAAFEKPTNFVWGLAPVKSTEEGEADSIIPPLPMPLAKERPKIKVFEEDVDLMDLEQPLTTSRGAGDVELPEQMEESDGETQLMKEITCHVAGIGGEIGPDEELNGGNDSPMLTTRTSVDIHDQSSIAMALSSEPNEYDNGDGAVERGQLAEKENISQQGQELPPNSEQKEEQLGDGSIPPFTRAPIDDPNSESPSASTVPSSEYPAHLSTDHGSRFYVKRRVVIGNVSRYVPPDKREPGMEKYEFKWMVYLEGPATSPDVTPFIRKVRFYLHPDYRPYDVVEVIEPPFRLTRYGWGEFPVRLQLYFVDERNKPVDFIHILKLDKAKSGRQMLGAERFVDLELDRNTEFGESREITSTDEAANTTEQPTAVSENTTNEAGLPAATESESENPFVAAPGSSLDAILADHVGRFPIIKPAASGPKNLPYTTASSITSYMSWPLGKRKATEFQRARLLLKHIEPMIDSEIGRGPNVKDIMDWCRSNGHTPVPEIRPLSDFPVETPSPTPDNASVCRRALYCRFCGILGAHDGECDRRPAMWRGRVWSLSSATEILRDAGITDVQRAEDDSMDIVVDSMENPALPAADSSTTSARWHLLNRRHPTASEQELEWINRTVNQLRLPTPIGENEESRVHTNGLIFEATRIFLRKLLGHTLDVFEEESRKESENVDDMELAEGDGREISGEEDKNDEQRLNPRQKIIVPLHVYKAILGAPDTSGFEILTGAGIGHDAALKQL